MLEAEAVRKVFKNPSGAILYALNGVDLSVGRGETVALVGESGCGKSTFARIALKLLKPTSGKVRFNGLDVHSLSRAGTREFRRSVQMIFQDPYASLNPRMRVGDIVGEPLMIHGLASKGDYGRKVSALMESVGLDPGMKDRYPREFSGGQRQRMGIARALAAGPALLVADEPVSALDVSVQAQILNLLADLKDERGLSMLFISHDLRVVARVADRLCVMYLGRVVEESPVDSFFEGPRHPYSRLLLSSVPEPDPEAVFEEVPQRGDPPSPVREYEGCPFEARCPEAMPVCGRTRPAETRPGPGRRVFCHLY